MARLDKETRKHVRRRRLLGLTREQYKILLRKEKNIPSPTRKHFNPRRRRRTRPMMNHEAGKVCLHFAADVLGALGVPFFLMQGTALGAYRDRGFVPTERDIDFGVLIEHMHPAAGDIAKALVTAGCEIESWGRPFGKIRTIVAKIGEAKIDIVGFHRWNGKRFATSPVNQWVPTPYSIVHDAELLENYQQIELFGRTFNIPSPIETYLEREYGADWRTPKDDHVSRTRIYNFTRDNGITDDNAFPQPKPDA